MDAALYAKILSDKSVNGTIYAVLLHNKAAGRGRKSISSGFG